MTRSILVDVLPEKEFFIHMLTKDISLQDCILDLLDNCVDGVNEYFDRNKQVVKKEETRYRGFEVNIDFDRSHFEINDNCGGITREVAEHYAFKLGKRKAIYETGHTIGLYGIGMKRAMFKMGNKLFSNFIDW